MPATTAEPAKILETIGLVVTPFATLTGLLYYFGWVRTNAIFAHYGIDANLLGYSPQDYLLRSAGVAFRPCAALLLAAGAALLAYRVISRASAGGWAHRRIVLADVAVLALLILVPSVGVLLGAVRTGTPLLAAAGIVAGSLLLEFAATGWPIAGDRRPERLIRRAVVAGAVVVGLFWSFAIHAQQTGERVAGSLRMSNAVVFSADDLALSGPGVTATKVAGDSAYPYRYAGLRLFIYRNGRWFLLPAGWRGDNAAAAIILPDSDKIRVELRP